MKKSTYKAIATLKDETHEWEITVSTCDNEQEASDALQHFLSIRGLSVVKTRVDEIKPRPAPRGKDKYAKLTDDLKAAFEETLDIENTPDGGSMCCDAPVLFLNRWNEGQVEAAVKAAGGIGVIKLDDWTRMFHKTAFSVIFRTTGRADRRSRRAEAIVSAMARKGYDALAYEATN